MTETVIILTLAIVCLVVAYLAFRNFSKAEAKDHDQLNGPSVSEVRVEAPVGREED